MGSACQKNKLAFLFGWPKIYKLARTEEANVNKRTELFIRLLGPKEIKLNQAIIIVIGTTALVFVVDYITPNELAFSFLSDPDRLEHACRRQQSARVRERCTVGIVWMAMRLLVGTVYTLPFFLIWSLLTRIATYVLFAFLLDSLKQAVAELQELSLHDPLDGGGKQAVFGGISRTFDFPIEAGQRAADIDSDRPR